jgi:hypothetical protein
MSGAVPWVQGAGDDGLAWAQAEVGGAQLGDPRRTRRLVQLVGALARQPTASLPQACAGWAATKGAYRFLASDQIAAEAIRAAQCAQTVERLRAEAAGPVGEAVLALQDTTELDFSTHRATAGLGSLGAVTHRGVLVHSVLAASAAGVPQGLVHQHVWARPPAARGTARTRRERPTAQKESQRWLDALAATQAAVPVERPVVVVGDAEADVYDLFALPRAPHAHWLVRVGQPHRLCRRTAEGPTQPLAAAVSAQPVGATRWAVVARRVGQPAREVRLRLRWARVWLPPPTHHPQHPSGPPLEASAILAEEDDASADPPTEAPLCWLLLTSWPVTDARAASQVVDWYAVRWLIERYHYVLKSGCRLEALQLQQARALERALAVYSVVAWYLLWLTYQARQTPTAPCTLTLSSEQWQMAYLATHPGTAVLPAQPPALAEAVRMIAQLGGFLGRTRDGDPGVTTLWRGWMRLQDLTLGCRLAGSHTPPADST